MKPFYRCDGCQAAFPLNENNYFLLGETGGLDLCAPCFAIASVEVMKARQVIMDRILELRTTGTTPTLLPGHGPTPSS